MNTEEITALVDRARAVEPISQPPADLLPLARAAARRHRLGVAGLGLLAAAVLIAPAAVLVVRGLDDGQPTPVASAAEDDTPRCPRQLPGTGESGGLDFGTEQPASRLPDLPTPPSAWVCEYAPVDPGTQASAILSSWVSQGDPRSIDTTALSRLAEDLDHLVLPDGTRACTDDLGPRWLLAYPQGSGLIGVVVDDFGCRDVRLTDDPFITRPGDADGDGTVPGRLVAPDGMVDRLRSAWAAG